ncbi:MAG: T9SS type A sorting domain-containing protein, partial [Chitinophagales bacterium]
MYTDWMGFNGQNMIRDSIGWDNPYLLANLPLLHPKNLRYPGGGLANWWDWHKGWFVDRTDLPEAYKGLKQLNNSLENYKKVLDACHANAILVVNMISSTVQDQMAMLRYADSIGIKVKLVELGNEFYLEGGDDSIAIMETFPTPEVYAAVASEWCDSIHKYFPKAKVAAQGAFNRNRAQRRITWDEGMLPVLKGEDVISYHSYMSAAAADEYYDNDTSEFTNADLPEMLFRPFKMWQLMSTEDLPLIPEKDEVWISEYNLRDKTRPSQGCWAHGLFVATQTMQYLNDTRITHIACHSMDGTAVDGALFFTSTGYDYGNAGHFIPPPNAPASTQYWGKTTVGITLQMLGLAVKNMTFTSPLEFKQSPMIGATDNGDSVYYPALYGWAFSNDDSTQAVVVNLSGTDLKINTEYVFPEGGSYERYKADPLLYVWHDGSVTHKTNANLPSTLTLKAYSITRMYSHTIPPPPPAARRMGAKGPTTFCQGDSVQLNAGSGYVYYLWSTGDTTQKIWAKNDGDYWVRVRTVTNGYWSADTMHITVHPLPEKPVINNIPNPSFCSGDTITLSVKKPKNTLSYSWSKGDLGTTAIITKGDNYTVTATSEFGCSNTSDEVSIKKYALPKPIITSSAATEFCWNQSVTLDAGSGFKSYSWSNGKVGQTINVTSSGTFTCTVKNNNNCEGTSPAAITTVHTPADPVITISGPTEFCDGTSPTSLQANKGYNYQWQKGSNILDGETNRKYYPVNDANFSVTITDDWGCSKKSSAVTMIVNPLPSAKISVTGGKSICIGLETTKLNVKTCTGCSYQWKLAGINIAGATSKSYTAALAGDFTYEVTDVNECSVVSSPVSILNDCRIEEEKKAYLSLYPNPATSVVHVSVSNLEEASNASIVISNLLGDVMKQENFSIENGTASLDIAVDQLINGMYLLTLQTTSAIFSQPLLIGGK